MIRLAKINELNLLLEIVNDAKALFKKNNIPQWQNGYPNRRTLANDIKNKSLYVYCENEMPLALANISLKADPQYNIIYEGSWKTSGPYAVIHRLAVKKEYLGQGLAKSLLLFAEELAVYNNIFSIRIDTHKDNIAMNSLLRKMGYNYCGVIELDDKNQIDYKRLAYDKSIKFEKK